MTRSVGIDVGGTFLKAVVVDGVDVEEDRAVEVRDGDVLRQVEEIGRGLLDASGAVALGIGVAGLVRWPEGRFVWGPHVAAENVPFRSELAGRLDVPVWVDNDANAAAYAEHVAGAAQGRDHVVMVTLGTGIGSGFVLGGTVYRGRSFAGEVGHITMQPDGEVCACGRRGCWETFVSGGRLDRAAARLVAEHPGGMVAALAAGEPAQGRHLVEAADRGDEAAVSILADAGRWLGRGIASLCLIFDPDVVVAGGAAAGAGEWLLGPARRSMTESMSGADWREPVDLVPARFGHLSGAVGAALLARTIGVDDD